MKGDGKMGYKGCSKSGGRQLDMFALAIVINDDIEKESRLGTWKTPANIGKGAYAQADCYDPSRRKGQILSMFSLKEPSSSGRKKLGGTDGSRKDEGCWVEFKDCN